MASVGARKVVALLSPGMVALDLSGPFEVFGVANGCRPGSYELLTLSADGQPVRCRNGITLVPDGSLADTPLELDTLVVAGADGFEDGDFDPKVVAWVRTTASQARRTMSVCTGAFLLAAAALLDGHAATTHWRWGERFGRRHPGVDLDLDAIYVRDGAVATSAGVTTGIDLALALVEEDLGRDVSRMVAQALVLALHRSGGQAQFSAQLTAQFARQGPIRELQAYVAEHPDADLSLAAMAARVALSTRQLGRLFTAEAGMSPATYVERARLDVARRLLAQTDDGLAAVARAAGFGSPATLRRAFRRHLGLTPSTYRARWRGA